MYHSISNNLEGSVLMISRAPRRDYANRKIEDIKKNRQGPAKLTEPQR
jgi:hypothetical protein